MSYLKGSLQLYITKQFKLQAVELHDKNKQIAIILQNDIIFSFH